MAYHQITIKANKPIVDLCSSYLFDLGTLGIEEKEDGNTLTAFFEGTNPLLVQSQIHDFFLSTDCEIDLESTEVAVNDWASEYKKYLYPQKISKSIFLKPAWRHDVEIPTGDYPIVMDPGQAFGVGTHASTKLALGLLERVINLRYKPQTISLLDVGTGTGILAIAASKLGVGHIDAVDNDPLAIETARRNCTLNHCENIKLIAGEIGQLNSKFDIIVSNILLETHLVLFKTYKRLLSRTGALILSGLLACEKPTIVNFARSCNLQPECVTIQGEWLAVLLVQ